MRRPPCPRCNGFLIPTWERDHSRVIKCLECGWRAYPYPPPDYDGCVALLVELFNWKQPHVKSLGGDEWTDGGH